MKPTLIDTDILSLFFRNHPVVVNHFAEYAREHRALNLSIITYYEVLSGLLHRDARRQLESFRSFAEVNRMLPLSESAANIAAQMYAETRKMGRPVDIAILFKPPRWNMVNCANGVHSNRGLSLKGCVFKDFRQPFSIC